MRNPDDNIDLDALFDSLHIGAGGADKTASVSKSAITSHIDLKTVDFQEMSVLDGDLFVFDTPSDQS